MSGATGTVFNAQIKGIDAASGPILAIARQMAGLKDTVKTLTEATKGLTKANDDGVKAHHRFIAAMSTHYQAMQGHLAGVSKSIASVRGGLTGLFPMLAALGVGGSFAGLFKLAQSTAEGSVKGATMMQQLGVSGPEFGALSYAAKLSRVETESLTGGLMKFNKVLAEIAKGKGPKDAVALFAKLRIDPRGKNPAELMLQLSDAFKRQTNDAVRGAMAIALFGRSGREMLPILMQGTGALRAMGAEGKRLGYVATPEQKRGMKEFADNWLGLETAIEGFKKMVGSALAPLLAPYVAMMREWVVANREWIATKIVDNVGLLVSWLQKLDIRKTVDDITEWVRWTDDLTNSTWGLRTALGAVALFLTGPFILAITSAGVAVAGLANAMGGLAVVTWANPILAIIAVIIISIGVLIVKWDEMTEFFRKQDKWVQVLLMALAPIWFVPIKIKEEWEPLKAFFTNLWASITGAFTAAMATIKPIVDTLRDFGQWLGDSSLGRFLSGQPPNPPGPRVAPRLQSPTRMPTYDGGDLLGPVGPPSGAGEGGGGGIPPDLLRRINPDNPLGKRSSLFLPDLYREGGPMRGLDGGAGEVAVRVSFDNLPQGTRVAARSTGRVQPPDIDAGYTSPIAPRPGLA